MIALGITRYGVGCWPAYSPPLTPPPPAIPHELKMPHSLHSVVPLYTCQLKSHTICICTWTDPLSLMLPRATHASLSPPFHPVQLSCQSASSGHGRHVSQGPPPPPRGIDGRVQAPALLRRGHAGVEYELVVQLHGLQGPRLRSRFRQLGGHKVHRPACGGASERRSGPASTIRTRHPSSRRGNTRSDSTSRSFERSVHVPTYACRRTSRCWGA